ncbi:MAG TPA: phosphoribosylanthranilate isomerase [Baekduia sp.]|uniref:phosphoribosylanthranilate isomerase n=1 Tax=Baekduia sp. TaxID=2600305 RepID=UPI002B7CC8D8|nr:phosphoribosylanthranilate isomerase [Baekduia sp.]HMJ35832.1 phosphoribosylanthranilate isomerase [Baekduia sp.]
MAYRVPRIKFCGITSLSDAELAVENDAWAIGLILWPESQRAADPAEGARIARQLRRQVEIAGVFVNQSLDEVERLADTIGLSLIQLHGDEGPAYANEVARRTGAKVVKAQSVRLASDVVAIQAFRTDFHLLDTHRDGLRGGTGETFDWDMVSRRYSKVPLILSGGLTPENVVQAIEKVHPFAVDVASGVEASPGVKDPDKVAAFAAAVRSTAAEGEEPPPAARRPSEAAAAPPAPPAGRGSPVRPPARSEAPTA